MGRRRNRRVWREDSSSSYASGEMSTEENPRTRSSNTLAATEELIRETMNKEGKDIKRMLKELKEDTSEMRKQLRWLIASHAVPMPHINGSSSHGSLAPRSQPDLVQLPRYRLEFTCEVKGEVQKGQIVETTDGKSISVALYDGDNPIAETESLASATIMLVIVNGEFNRLDNLYNWSREDFEKSVKRPRQGNPATSTRDGNQRVKSIVSNCVFKLDGGVKSHIDATILENSSNKKVRLGVMTLSQTEERVLEGLSNTFFVRGHDRPTRLSNMGYNMSKKQKCNVPLQDIEDPSRRFFTQAAGIRFDLVAAEPQPLPNTEEPTAAPLTIQQPSVPKNQISQPTMNYTEEGIVSDRQTGLSSPEYYQNEADRVAGDATYDAYDSYTTDGGWDV